ncbi:hypothetical protein Dimus_033449 [Dionaea muscipula]
MGLRSTAADWDTWWRWLGKISVGHTVNSRQRRCLGAALMPEIGGEGWEGAVGVSEVASGMFDAGDLAGDLYLSVMADLLENIHEMLGVDGLPGLFCFVQIFLLGCVCAEGGGFCFS